MGKTDVGSQRQSHHMQLARRDDRCRTRAAVVEPRVSEVVADVERPRRGLTTHLRRTAENDVQRVGRIVPCDDRLAWRKFDKRRMPNELAQSTPADPAEQRNRARALAPNRCCSRPPSTPLRLGTASTPALPIRSWSPPSSNTDGDSVQRAASRSHRGHPPVFQAKAGRLFGGCGARI